jgi:hypothetical protein
MKTAAALSQIEAIGRVPFVPIYSMMDLEFQDHIFHIVVYWN